MELWCFDRERGVTRFVDVCLSKWHPLILALMLRHLPKYLQRMQIFLMIFFPRHCFWGGCYVNIYLWGTTRTGKGILGRQKRSHRNLSKRPQWKSTNAPSYLEKIRRRSILKNCESLTRSSKKLAVHSFHQSVKSLYLSLSHLYFSNKLFRLVTQHFVDFILPDLPLYFQIFVLGERSITLAFYRTRTPFTINPPLTLFIMLLPLTL